MKLLLVQLLAYIFITATVAMDTIHLEPSQGVLIPAPYGQTLRIARATYGSDASTGSAFAAATPVASYATTSSSNIPYSAAPAVASYSAKVATSYAPPSNLNAYNSPSSMFAPPCAKNFLFSCQPSLAPVPCSGSSYAAPPGPSYFTSSPHHGGHSHSIPQYTSPYVRELY